MAVVAIVQDQHPDRARLFLQWKQIDWPVLADSLDLLNLETVPLTVAVDEYGIVRFSELPMSAAKTIEQTFVNQTYPRPPTMPAPYAKPDLAALRAATARNTAAAWRAYGDALVVWGGDRGLSDAIDAYRRAAQLEPEDGSTQFRLGSALRKRYDSAERKPTDFQVPRSIGRRRWTSIRTAISGAAEASSTAHIWRRPIPSLIGFATRALIFRSGARRPVR